MHIITGPRIREGREINMARRELLVLGNGFDLQCGLESGYSDFENPRISKLKKRKLPEAETQVDWFTNQMLTIWDLILRADYPNTWYDVEASIARWISIQIDFNSLQYRSPSLNIREKIIYNNVPFWLWPDTESSIGYYARAKYNWKGGSQQLLDILLKELKIYESEFTQYMNEQISTHASYYERAQKNIEALANDRPDDAKQHRDLPDKHVPHDKWLSYLKSMETYGNNADGLTILDFNFTEPLLTLRDRFPLSVNVHGNLTDGNVIFGVDGTNFDMDAPENSGKVRFTKTYRLMQLRTEEYAPIVSPDTDTIKFYGHSLGPADYAYFQSIFDTIDLYGGKTHLIFYYHTEFAAQEMYGKVNRLINTYGKTLDNQNHGKNLLHKLLLEGRLNVIKAPI